ncbi:F-box/LRR-repeat protein At4g29420-like, partial [Bidens hawaiensis]|uniref:F-box/LRR-repeat protein At4g29420-like n=1 Tax=Bidens hawaiensis TaxID=980011 RepID=UPI004049E107
TLPDSLLLDILSRLDDSADVARCRVASKAFHAVFPGLRSVRLSFRNINLRYWGSDSFNKIFLDLILKLETVESVSMGIFHDQVYTHEAWLPRVSRSLKSLSMSGINCSWRSGPNVLLPISVYCHNLVSLKLSSVCMSMPNLNPISMLTSFTLESMYLNDEDLNELNKCFPNLQVLNMVYVKGLKDPKIHHLNLQACHWDAYNDYPLSLTLITPNLITLKIGGYDHVAIHVEAPMLSHFHLRLTIIDQSDALFTFTKFENLKTLWLESLCIGSLLSEFPITNTVETLTLYSPPKEPEDAHDSKRITLAKVFMVFPNVSSLCISSGAWSRLEACMNPEGCETVDGSNRLKTFSAYLLLVDSLLTFSSVACVLDQCVSLSEVSLLIHSDVSVTKSESFKSKCMARWPGLKWRWGIWNEHREDSWITDGISNKHHRSSKKHRLCFIN